MGFGRFLIHRLWAVFSFIREFIAYVGDNLFPVECTSEAKLLSKTVIITGANTGIGKETALDLAGRGAKVIIACRDTEKGRKAAKDIYDRVPYANIIVKQLDLASFSSIRKFAADILKSEPRIHILINNAGICGAPKSKTAEGFEMHFAVNHLGHFLLTNLLLDRIKASAPARIVNVASYYYWFGKINFDNINLDRDYNRFNAYFNTKLANILTTRELARRLKGTGVTAYSLHPGIINTEIARHFKTLAFGSVGFLYRLVERVWNKTPKQGAQTTIYCAVDEGIANESGLFYCACKSAPLMAKAKDEECAKKLWKLSEALIASSTNCDILPSK